MTPADYRNETFESLQRRLHGIRAQVYQGMLAAGGERTTREWAALLEIDILTVRPRITELCQLGFVVLTGGEKGQGIYRALSPYMARAVFDERARAVREPQLELKL